MLKRSIAYLPMFLLLSAVLFASHPGTVVSWDAFPDADGYQIRIKNSGGSIVSGPTDVATTSVVLGDLMSGQAEGSYQFEVRAKSGEFFSAWSAPASFSWSTEIPGTVTGIVFTD